MNDQSDQIEFSFNIENQKLHIEGKQDHLKNCITFLGHVDANPFYDLNNIKKLLQEKKYQIVQKSSKFIKLIAAGIITIQLKSKQQIQSELLKQKLKAQQTSIQTLKTSLDEYRSITRNQSEQIVSLIQRLQAQQSKSMQQEAEIQKKKWKTLNLADTQPFNKDYIYRFKLANVSYHPIMNNTHLYYCYGGGNTVHYINYTTKAKGTCGNVVNSIQYHQ